MNKKDKIRILIKFHKQLVFHLYIIGKIEFNRLLYE